MPKYNVHEAKTNLSQLLKQVERGEEVVIMRAGEPVAKLVRCRPATRKKIKLGLAAGQVVLKPGWDKPMTDAEVEAWVDGKL
jgi:prevent-host-death family protein